MNNIRWLLAALMLPLPMAGAAWQSEVHTGLTQLTRTIIDVPGFWESSHAIMLAGDAPERCNKDTRKTRLKSKPQLAVFDELVCGADDPDAERWPWENDAHQNKAEKFAVDEFNAAVKAYGNYRTRGAVALAEAANHLGRSLHFIEDLTDVSKDMHGSAPSQVRNKAKVKVQAYLAEWSRTKKYPPQLASQVNRMRSELGAGPSSPAELVYNAKAQRKVMGNDMTAVLKDRDEPGSVDSKLDKLVHLLVGGSIVIQEYWVDLYLRQIGVRR